MEETLTRLNFAELTIPRDITPDPAQALTQNKSSMTRAQRDVEGLEGEVRNICGEFKERAYQYEPIVRRSLGVENARATFSRTETLSLVHGWIPIGQQEPLTGCTGNNKWCSLPQIREPRTER